MIKGRSVPNRDRLYTCVGSPFVHYMYDDFVLGWNVHPLGLDTSPNFASGGFRIADEEHVRELTNSFMSFDQQRIARIWIDDDEDVVRLRPGVWKTRKLYVVDMVPISQLTDHSLILCLYNEQADLLVNSITGQMRLLRVAESNWWSRPELAWERA